VGPERFQTPVIPSNTRAAGLGVQEAHHSPGGHGILLDRNFPFNPSDCIRRGQEGVFQIADGILQTGNNIRLLTWYHGEHSEENTMIAGGPECFSRDWTHPHDLRNTLTGEPRDDDIKFTTRGIQVALAKYSVRSVTKISDRYYALNVEELGTVKVKLSAYCYTEVCEERPEDYVIVILGYYPRFSGTKTFGMLLESYGSRRYKVPTNYIHQENRKFPVATRPDRSGPVAPVASGSVSRATVALSSVTWQRDVAL
jgi:hypothetical protein